MNRAAVEQALRGRHRHHGRRASRPPPLSPKMRTRSGSPPKLAMLSLHPLQRKDGVEQTHAGCVPELTAAEIAEIKISKRVETVVDRHDNHVLLHARGARRHTRRMSPEPVENPPPWIQNITGR